MALDDRRMFLEVARTMSFSEAARDLGVPLSTLSRRVAALEDELGVQLLERTSRYVRLTEVGESYAAQVRPLVLGIADVEAAVAQGGVDSGGSLRVAVPPGLVRPLLNHALVALQERFPDLVLTLLNASAKTHPIRDGVDIVVAEQAPNDHDLVATKVLDTDYVCVASPAYLKRAGTPRSPGELSGHRTVVMGVDLHSGHWPVRGGGTVATHPVFRCDDYGVLLDAVKHGMGIGLVPRLALFGVDHEQLETVLEGSVGRKARYLIVYQRHARRRPMVSAFIDFSKSFARAVQAQLTCAEGPGQLRAR